MTDEEITAMYAEMAAAGHRLIERWAVNQADYGDAFMELGPKGQFSDIWRKIKKLKRAVWDEEPLRGEQPVQIIDETVHHLLMLRYLLLMEAS